MYTYTHTHIRLQHYVHTNEYLYTHVHLKFVSILRFHLTAQVGLCMCINIYIYIHTYTHTLIRKQLYKHICVCKYKKCHCHRLLLLNWLICWPPRDHTAECRFDIMRVYVCVCACSKTRVVNILILSSYYVECVWGSGYFERNLCIYFGENISYPTWHPKILSKSQLWFLSCKHIFYYRSQQAIARISKNKTRKNVNFGYTEAIISSSNEKLSIQALDYDRTVCMAAM